MFRAFRSAPPLAPHAVQDWRVRLELSPPIAADATLTTEIEVVQSARDMGIQHQRQSLPHHPAPQRRLLSSLMLSHLRARGSRRRSSNSSTSSSSSSPSLSSILASKLRAWPRGVHNTSRWPAALRAAADLQTARARPQLLFCGCMSTSNKNPESSKRKGKLAALERNGFECHNDAARCKTGDGYSEQASKQLNCMHAGVT